MPFIVTIVKHFETGESYEHLLILQVINITRKVEEICIAYAITLIK